jgi:hypothetical protein
MHYSSHLKFFAFYSLPLPLDFGHLGRERKASEQERERLPWKLHALRLSRRVHQIAGTPEMPSYQCQTVGERRLALAIPGGHGHRDVPVLAQRQGQDGDEREQGQQNRGGAGDGLVRPLALGLQPQMGAGLLTRHLD